MPRPSSRNSSGRRNLLAAGVTVLSVVILYSSFDPVPAGEDVVNFAAPQPAYEFDESDEADVPLPPDAAVSPEPQADESTASVKAQPPAPARAREGSILSSMETIKFCVLLLQDGARYMKKMDDYTVHFHREERIGGDMKTPQTIAMKVQHSPSFAVYMNWQTGARGQQVLFSKAYDDGNMVVKLGGMKRFLPAVRIDPHSSLAKAESRYPVTEAGVLGMINQILNHRQIDLKRGHGVSCVRLSDDEFDGHKCYRFLLKYEDQKFNEVYRKSLLLVDARRHIPLMVRNFTWAADSEGLSPEELDKSTLIENYSFTNLDTSKKLVAEDFSRENPKYRM